MEGLKRRAAMSAAVLAALIGVTAGCLLFRAGSPEAVPAQSAQIVEAAENPVTAFRTEREQLRARQKSQLNDIIYNASSDETTVMLAQRQLMELMRSEEAELTLEGVLRLRGFEDALVTVHTDSVNVIVRTEALTQRETAVITELVLRETGVTGGNVKILPIN